MPESGKRVYDEQYGWGTVGSTTRMIGGVVNSISIRFEDGKTRIYKGDLSERTVYFTSPFGWDD
ncbi:MAG TPA: hypothetical protein VMR75_02860 [Candidatus Saccharimonadales bacterium]|nr:hypothetical protein [Candidatus Saccharimonadales bacterium]